MCFQLFGICKMVFSLKKKKNGAVHRDEGERGKGETEKAKGLIHQATQDRVEKLQSRIIV